jgi:hypothetical protein
MALGSGVLLLQLSQPTGLLGLQPPVLLPRLTIGDVTSITR